MDYSRVLEFRERLVERYDPVSLVEILDITVDELFDAFPDRILDNNELAEELGL